MEQIIKITKEEKSVVIEGHGKRYQVYFDGHDYAIFVGETGNGSLVTITSAPNGILEFYSHY